MGNNIEDALLFEGCRGFTFVVKDGRYAPCVCGKLNTEPYRDGFFSRLVPKKYLPHRFFIERNFHEIVEWLSDHTTGAWTFGVPRRGWYVMIEKPVDAVHFRLVMDPIKAWTVVPRTKKRKSPK